MKILFCVDEKNGLGHKVRSGALRDELVRRGHSTQWCSWYMGSPNDEYDVTVFDGRHPHSDYPEVLAEAWRDLSPNTKLVYITDELFNGFKLPYELVVNGGAGADANMYAPDCGADIVLAGPEFALLRPEFKAKRAHLEAIMFTMGFRDPAILDLRNISNLSADILTQYLYSASVMGDEVQTFGGMRALEAACLHCYLEIYPRNEGELRNAQGLVNGAIIDGLGCERVADAIESL